MKPFDHVLEELQARATSDWLLLLLALLAAAWFALRMQQFLQRRRRRRRSADAQDAERRAAQLLHESGFEILARQAPRRWTVLFDDHVQRLQLRVDYLTRRGGRLYVADAKCGQLATSWNHAATRRQLLEYLLAYQADGALLVDMERERIIEVRFPELD